MKEFNGPYGNYAAGTFGAVLNAMCEQEGRPSSVVSNYALGGNGKVMANSASDKVVATYIWKGDEIIFTWM